MRSKFRDTVDVLTKVSSSESVNTDTDHCHEQQLSELSKMVLVMKVT